MRFAVSKDIKIAKKILSAIGWIIRIIIMWAQHPTKGQGRPIDCLPHLHLSHTDELLVHPF